MNNTCIILIQFSMILSIKHPYIMQWIIINNSKHVRYDYICIWHVRICPKYRINWRFSFGQKYEPYILISVCLKWVLIVWFPKRNGSILCIIIVDVVGHAVRMLLEYVAEIWVTSTASTSSIKKIIWNESTWFKIHIIIARIPPTCLCREYMAAKIGLVKLVLEFKIVFFFFFWGREGWNWL